MLKLVSGFSCSFLLCMGMLLVNFSLYAVIRTAASVRPIML
jgi:hypothetical protein